jgi:hypothetical protein
MGKIQIRDPGWKKSGSGINILDHISEKLETIFWVRNAYILCAGPDLGSGALLTLDPGYGMEKFGSGSILTLSTLAGYTAPGRLFVCLQYPTVSLDFTVYVLLNPFRKSTYFLSLQKFIHT